MRRREFIVFLAGAAVMMPLAAHAQQTAMPTLGVLVLGNPDPQNFLDGFREELAKAGYIDGRNVKLEVRSADGKADRLAPAALELVRLKPAAIVGWQTPAVAAAKQATNEIPIVMAGAADPVGTGLIASLARPGGNVTGVASVGPELAGKVVELIRELLPSARRIAVLANAADPFTPRMLEGVERSARSVALETRIVRLRPGDPLEAIFAGFGGQQIDAVFIQPTLVRKEAADLALAHRLPLVSFNRQLPPIGGLLGYVPNISELNRDAASYVDRILKGAGPATLPVTQPTKFELIVNMKTAKALGIAVPPAVLVRADEVIE